MARGDRRGDCRRRSGPRRAAARPRRRRGASAWRGDPDERPDAVRQHDPARRRARAAGRPGARATGALAGPLERDRDRAARQRGVVGARRPHRLLPVGGGPLRDRLQPLLARAERRARRRPRLHPGPQLARDLRALLPRGPAQRRADGRLPPGGERRGRAQLLPASVVDAELLAVPDRLDGPRADHGDPPGVLHALPRRPRDRRHLGPQGLGLPRRRRDRRARVARRDRARRQGGPRQPRLRHQLQPAAPRRARARQRQDHPGARDDLPRRRLERDQGDLGSSLGPADRRRRERPAAAAHGGCDRRRVPGLQVARRRLRP